MTAASDQELLSRAVRNPGRFVLGPTATSGAFPYGGVPLGTHRDGEVVWHADYVQSRDPASGAVSEIGRRGVDYPEVYCLVEGPNWDEDSLLAIFTKATRSSALAVVDPAEVRVEGTGVPSQVRAWPPILFASLDPLLKSVYFRRPYPTLSLRQSVAISMEKHAGLPVRFVPSLSSTWQTIPDWQVARLENISL